ncbi:MAG: hypothetical protein GXY42_06935 [Desulfovibrionales bacterium]|nr:hypothetical protein [Desulfovibrionales bacterium]
MTGQQNSNNAAAKAVRWRKRKMDTPSARKGFMRGTLLNALRIPAAPASNMSTP